jgi:hypothetical protein
MMQLPGFLSYKPGRDPYLSRIFQEHQALPYPAETILKKFGQKASTGAGRKKEGRSYPAK